ncbi:cell division protein FtsX [Amylibacter marinus]|uniref:Cell division protein FtsX n=1 Tax=Amylibacter marinus TaxID=1475483 RepID=A0ABQ5VUW9_9RHOB|nr:FtsX-like permease family protein [Amylibacter marinus]GLQ35065.1 cell division protein FtsX [Amylibacter marinus]
MGIVNGIQMILAGDKQADRVVPPAGFTARLTSFTAAVMSFLVVFALALSMATGRLADRWSAELSRTSTVRISAPEAQLEIQSERVMEILETTKGIASARLMRADEQHALLEPWFGPDLPLDNLPIPRLIEVVEESVGPDMEGLRFRLAAEAPGAVLDDHTRWRRPLVDAAARLRMLAVLSICLIGGALAAMITLAAQAALAANTQVIQVLRLVGAKDKYIAKAFVRRFTLRGFFGALFGSVCGMVAIFLLPSAAAEGAFLTGLGFSGMQWFIPLLIPLIAAILAFWATRIAANRTLARMN